MSRRFIGLAVAFAAALPQAAEAQAVDLCGDYRSSVFALAEPWETSTRLFADGAVRLAVMDTVEPAAGAFHLIILSPPYDELGTRQCRILSGTDGLGFAGLTLEGITADYDPATGLTFVLPARRWLPESDSYADAVLTVTLNQATGDITARLD
jgi:hypothetical protein